MITQIISWNVLYRDYEKEYKPDSKILLAYPNEEEREDEIINMLNQNITLESVVCLQEVSQNLLDKIFEKFSQTYKIFFYNIRYEEFLVTLTPFNFEMVSGYSNNTSNGYLIVKNNYMKIINCHLVPQCYTHENVLRYVRKFSNDKLLTFVAGDFNELYKVVRSRLQTNFICPYYGRTYKKKPIDQIIFNQSLYKYRSEKVLQRNLSDHRMIKLQIYQYF